MRVPLKPVKTFALVSEIFLTTTKANIRSNYSTATNDTVYTNYAQRFALTFATYVKKEITFQLQRNLNRSEV